MTQVVLGIGCDRNVSLQTLQEAVAQALGSTALNADAVIAVATIDKKSDETALLQLAAQHQWPMHFYNAQQLSQVAVPNPSATVLKYMGTPAVAEAAAILAANTTQQDLLVEKFKYRGGDDKNATVSIVRYRNAKR